TVGVLLGHRIDLRTAHRPGLQHLVRDATPDAHVPDRGGLTAPTRLSALGRSAFAKAGAAPVGPVELSAVPLVQGLDRRYFVEPREQDEMRVVEEDTRHR